MNESCQTNESCHACIAIASPIAINTPMNSCSPSQNVCTCITWHICHTCEWTMSHVNVNESIMSHMYMYCHTITNCQQHLHEFVQPFAGRMHKHDLPYMSHLWMNHVTYVRKWIMSHVHVNESCHIYTCTTTPLPIASNISMSSCSPSPLQDVFKCVTWRIHTYDMTHSQVWHASFIHVISLSIFLSVSLSHPLPPLTNCQQDFHKFVQPFAVEQLVETRWQR